ncbi:hypothetical protein [Cellulosimicrobium sp. 22601]|uniref:hypothetical protein n=1 Tax=unclassified Cellulosimicrobium TaxID=2624466 RepID=UPI003F8705FC
MTKKLRRVAVAAMLTLGLTTGLSLVAAAPASAATCGTTISTYTDWLGFWRTKVTYKNCSGFTVNRKVQLDFAPDTSCVTIQNGQTKTWTFRGTPGLRLKSCSL